jgi:serine/threonine protein kinase
MVATVDDFLRTVLRSGLLERDRLQTTLRGLPLAEREAPQSIADFLVAKKLLTSFQAQKLLAGVSLGLKLGPYLVQTPIGKGGMGTVYLAKDSRTSQPVAIKVLSPQRVQEGQRHLARFQREMVLSRKLQHPNVALTKDVGEVQGVHYLALEYIPGVTLHRLVTRDGPLSPPRAARLFVEVCSALEHAHEQGLIHRDLKPTNIMVTPDDHAKVLDLGLALMEGEVVEDPEVVGGKGYIVGSVEYIAPEQTHDPTQVDARADLYSLGCTLYFALCGKPPFATGNSKDKVLAHRHQNAEPIRRRTPAVPEALGGLVQRLMAKDPSLRPQTAAVVRQELVAFSDPPAPPAKPTDSAILFEIVEDLSVDDVPDTLSEVFQFEGEAQDAPTVSRDSARSLFAEHKASSAVMWLVLAVAAVGVVVLIFIVLMARMR